MLRDDDDGLLLVGSGRHPTDESLQIADAGNYTCNATNVHLPRGLSQTTKLIVERKP